ncbi:phage scaffolding protein [Lichenicoccus roseus]|uniref:Uncharacterized protein n=1 Tax=Lichenicoccus roseus TaxID=2683649 RepID=A0A5R9J6U5_9PROT|nr:hypothetical protein [Lichenicoccus roseus]TLU72689.1 hypothetical protein FE263_11695 [Lichenicoccus roseus]
MSDLQNEIPDDAVDAPTPDAVDPSRESTEYEKRLRRDLVRVREQARAAQSDRDAGVAAANRDRDEAIASLRTDLTERIIRSELKAHAIRAGIVDLDALRLADTATLSLGDNGDVVGAEALIDGLRLQKPYLFVDSQARSGVATTAQTLRAPAPALPTEMDARTLPREAWLAERNRLLAPRG